MTSSSCSHWWHAPVYIAAAVAIVIAATSSSLSSSPHNQEAPRRSISVDASSDAILALYRSGFRLTAAVLQISPGFLLPSARPATLFAVLDAAVAKLPLSAADELLHYHAVPLRLSHADLLLMPRGTCFPTLVPNKNLVVTASGGQNGSVSINGVLISHPDLYVDGAHVIHGTDGAFHRSGGPITDPQCERKVANPGLTVAQWTRLIRALGARGYVSFAVALTAVLDAVAREVQALGDVTVFAPQGGGFDHVASPRPLLELAVKRHVVVGRLRLGELAAMHVGEEIRTLAGDGDHLRITAGAGSCTVAINGVEITEPKLFAAEGVLVHGIAEPLEMPPRRS